MGIFRNTSKGHVESWAEVLEMLPLGSIGGTAGRLDFDNVRPACMILNT